MAEKLFSDAPVSQAEVDAARNRFVREFAQTMGWDPQNLNEQQAEQIRRQSGWRAAGMVRS